MMQAKTDPPENELAIRLRRARMRSWRRGTKEMDLILGPFADTQLSSLSEHALGRYEALLGENDHDLYTWVSGRAETPSEHADILQQIRRFHGL